MLGSCLNIYLYTTQNHVKSQSSNCIYWCCASWLKGKGFSSCKENAVPLKYQGAIKYSVGQVQLQLAAALKKKIMVPNSEVVFASSCNYYGGVNIASIRKYNAINLHI